MFLWFVGVSLVMVWQVFRDPAIDHRMVVVGVLVPDLIDGAAGGATIPHSLIFSVGLLLLVMLSTRGNRLRRRRLLALPIGSFLHLVLDGMWTNTEVFWWPFLGGWFPASQLPSLERPLLVVLVMELAGAAALAWFWQRFRLGNPALRRRFIQSGRLDPELRG